MSHGQKCVNQHQARCSADQNPSVNDQKNFKISDPLGLEPIFFSKLWPFWTKIFGSEVRKISEPWTRPGPTKILNSRTNLDWAVRGSMPRLGSCGPASRTVLKGLICRFHGRFLVDMTLLNSMLKSDTVVWVAKVTINKIILANPAWFEL